MSVKTVIFDLGGVYFTDGTSNAIEIISQKYDISKELVADVFKGKIGTMYRKNEILHEDFWNQTKKFLNISEENDVLAKIWLNGYVPIDGTVEIIEKLINNGYELLFLSDNVQERVDYLQEKYNFLKHFKDGVFSHLIGTRKPDIKMYECVLEKTESKASDCVYIDDKEELLLPARKLDMKTIHFTSPKLLKEKLVLLGVKI